jgi:hypothetical protein
MAPSRTLSLAGKQSRRRLRPRRPDLLEIRSLNSQVPYLKELASVGSSARAVWGRLALWPAGDVVNAMRSLTTTSMSSTTLSPMMNFSNCLHDN